MSVESIYHGCPICQGSVSGNKELGYLCGTCTLVFHYRYIVRKKRKQQLASFPNVPLFVTNKERTTIHKKTCKYARRINNPVRLHAEELTQNMRYCKCTGRKN